jgi:argininosuccinate lyase
LDQIPVEVLVGFHPDLKSEVLGQLNVLSAVNSRNSDMGTSPKSVAASIATLEGELNRQMQEISRIRKAFSGMISQ